MPEETVRSAASGHAAQAIQGAETQLAQRLSDSAELDRQVGEALRRAHLSTVRGAQRLDHLEAEIVDAARTWDLGTPVGEREFQSFLSARLDEIIRVVEDTDGDATATRALAAALTALYRAPAGSDDREPTTGPPPTVGGPADLDGVPGDGLLGDYLPDDYLPDDYLPDEAPPPGPATPWHGAPVMPELSGVPGLGGEPLGLGAPPGAGMQGLPLGLLSGLHRADTQPDDGPAPGDPAPDGPDADPPALTEDGADVVPEAAPAGPVTVRLPDGTTTTVADPELAAAIQAVADGTPVGEAFAHQGIALPAPGATIDAPVDQTRLQPGDVGVFTDRYALALGDGRALLDGQFQDVTNLRGPGFLGWLHPRGSAADPDTAPEPEPTRPATAVDHPGR